MIKFALGVSVTINVFLGAAVAAAAIGTHTSEGASIINLYLKKRGYLAPRD